MGRSFKAIVAVLLVFCTLALVLTNCFGLSSPATQIGRALQNTLNKENFTLLITTTVNDTTTTSACQVSIDHERRDLTLICTNADQKIRFAICDGYILYRGLLGYYSLDISEKIHQFFVTLENTGDLDLDMLLPDNVDTYKAEQAFGTLYIRANNCFWLRRHAGYSQDRQNGTTVHRFAPDYDDLSWAILKEFKNAFHTPEDHSEALQQLRGSFEQWKEQELSVSVGIKDGHIVSFSYSTQTRKGTKTVNAELTQLGSTHIDTAAARELLSSARQLG